MKDTDTDGNQPSCQSSGQMNLTEALAIISDKLPIGWSFRILDDWTHGNVFEVRVWRWTIVNAHGYMQVARPNSQNPREFENVEVAILNLASFLLSNGHELRSCSPWL